MFDIQTNRDLPNTLTLFIDGLFHVELNRDDEGLSIYVNAAQTGDRITETSATDDDVINPGRSRLK